MNEKPTPTREQLELAAKVAGVTHIEYTNGYDGKYGLQLCDEIGRHTRSWNPTTSKSDSFNLMVACGIEVAFDNVNGVVDTTHTTLNSYIFLDYKDYNNDKGLATMWAVFLCAVELGRKA
jgi:hypothetical protein